MHRLHLELVKAGGVLSGDVEFGKSDSHLMVQQLNGIALNNADSRAIALYAVEKFLKIDTSDVLRYAGGNVIGMTRDRIYIELLIANSKEQRVVKNHMDRRDQFITTAFDNGDRKSVDIINQFNQMVRAYYYEINQFIDGINSIEGMKFNELNDVIKYMFLWDASLLRSLVWSIEESWLLPQDKNNNLRLHQSLDLIDRIIERGLSTKIGFITNELPETLFQSKEQKEKVKILVLERI